MGINADTLKERLRTARMVRNLTQQELAESAKVTQSQISKLERGEVLEPSFFTVSALGEALKLDLAALASDNADDFLKSLHHSEEPKQTGVVIGRSLSTGAPVVINTREGRYPSQLITGATGSGKSYCVKTQLIRLAEQGVGWTIIDPTGEYSSLAEKLGASVDVIGEDASINPLSREIQQAHVFVMEWLMGFASSFTPAQKMILSEVLERGSNQPQVVNHEGQSIEPSLITLRDALHIIRKTVKMGIEDRISPEEINQLIAVLDRFKKHKEILESTQLNPSVHWVIDLSRVPNAFLPAMTQLAMAYVYSNREGVVVVDEAHNILHTPEGLRVMEFMSRARPSMSLQLVTSAFSDMVWREDGSSNKEGLSLIKHMDNLILFKSDIPQADALESVIGGMADSVRRLEQTGEALLVEGEDQFTRLTLRDALSAEEYRLIQTSPKETQ